MATRAADRARRVKGETLHDGFLRHAGFRWLKIATLICILAIASYVLVTDHLMPGTTGTDLVEQAKRLKPEIRTLLISGYADNAGIPADLPRLTKPFKQIDLAKSLAAL